MVGGRRDKWRVYTLVYAKTRSNPVKSLLLRKNTTPFGGYF